MREAGPPCDLVGSFALPVPSLVICELLGVPYGDRALFQQRTRTLLSFATEGPELLRAREELRAYMLELVQSKRAEPDEHLLSALVHHDGEDRLDDEELINIGLLLLVAGHETTANMLGLGTLALLRHPAEIGAAARRPRPRRHRRRGAAALPDDHPVRAGAGGHRGRHAARPVHPGGGAGGALGAGGQPGPGALPGPRPARPGS